MRKSKTNKNQTKKMNQGGFNMKTFVKLFAILAATTALVFFAGCEKSQPVAPSADYTGGINDYGENQDFTKKIKYEFPMSASCVLTYDESLGGYRGGGAFLSEGSGFIIPWNSLIPPPGTPKRAPVTIDIMVDRDNVTEELIFDFGPCGCQFSWPVTLIFSWKALGAQNVQLFYIDDNGNRIEMQPEDINVFEQWMLIKVNHFSRYAIAISR